MALSYPLPFPTITGVRTQRVTPEANVAVSEAPFDFTEQTQVHQGERWVFEFSAAFGKRVTHAIWVGFLVGLNGRQGTFTVGDKDAQTALGSASSSPGTPVIDGASQTGKTLNIDGVPSGASNYLKIGDYIQLANNRLHIITANGSADSAGNIALEIWPSLRESPSDGATVIVDSTVGIFRLANNRPTWSINTAGIYTVNFIAVEAVE